MSFLCFLGLHSPVTVKYYSGEYLKEDLASPYKCGENDQDGELVFCKHCRQIIFAGSWHREGVPVPHWIRILDHLNPD